MTNTLPGLGVFGDLFSTSQMQATFSEEAWFARMVEVEAGLARAQGGVGVIPPDAANLINAACRSLVIDTSALKTATENVGYPVLPLVRQISAAAGEAGGYVHWGATTQDIMDTALVLQMRQCAPLSRSQSFTSSKPHSLLPGANYEKISVTSV